MTLNILLLDANAIICMMIACRLMFFRKSDRTHRQGIAWLAYALILASGFTAFRILFGHYTRVDPGELAMNMAILITLVRAKGNLARIVNEG
jgi:hypothetical protein